MIFRLPCRNYRLNCLAVSVTKGIEQSERTINHNNCLMRSTKSVLLGVSLSIVIPWVVSADDVSTAFGSGADVEMREQSDNFANNTSQNTRTSSGGDRNEIVGLAFDLSSYTLSELENVSLNLYSFRNDTSTRFVDLYGVAFGTAAPQGGLTPATWDESNLSTFGSMPGLLATDSDYLTQSLDVGNLVSLGQITVAGASEGDLQTFSDAAITTFIQGYAGSRVTFLLAAGNDSTGQFRTATKETTATATGVLTGDAGDFAPYLSFVVPEPSSMALIGMAGLVMTVARRRR